MTEEVWKETSSKETNRTWLYTPEIIRKSAESRKKKIYGVGINDISGYLKGVKLYVCWKSMFARSYDVKFQRANPMYIGCSVDKRWHRLSEFKKWFDENYREGYALDKDILTPNNKVYGPDTCCFVPDYLNRVFKTNTFKREKIVGVRKQYNKYTSRFRGGGEIQNASFDTFEEARLWYVDKRVSFMKEVAKEYLENKLITTPIYNGLIRIANDNY